MCRVAAAGMHVPCAGAWGRSLGVLGEGPL